jgi:hypothetical protein
MSALLLCVIFVGYLGEDPSPLEAVGRLDAKVIPEASGIVKSRRFPDVFWVHNDSGNPPLLFAIDGAGRLIGQFRLDLPNVDWEDIAADDAGHLYLGDIGNNLHSLPIRMIYRIDEPDPRATSKKPIPASEVTFIKLPRDNRFDAESLVVLPGRALVIAKYLDHREAEVFEIVLDGRSRLLQPTAPRLLGPLAGFREPATGADLNADQTLLAVCSATATRIYQRENGEIGRWKPIASVRYRAMPIEGIAWDRNDLRLVAEGGGYYRISEKSWRARILPEITPPKNGCGGPVPERKQ